MIISYLIRIGSTIYADCHFTSIAQKLKKVKIITPTPKKRGKRAVGTKRRDNDLPADVVKVNKQIARIRSRVERPFACAERKFTALSQPFYEGDEQLDYLVHFALGVVAYEH